MEDRESAIPSSRLIQQRLNDHRQLLARLTRLEALNRGDIEAALAQVTELASELLHVARASFWRFDAHNLTLRCENLFIADKREHESGLLISREQAPRYFEALTRERCIAADDACMDPRTNEFARFYLTPLGIGAMLDAPVFVRGVMVGVVCHEHIGGPRHWEFWEELLAGTVADFVALLSEAAERLRAERQLGLYRSHLEELSRLRASELEKIHSGLGTEVKRRPSAAGTLRSAPERTLLDGSPVPFVVTELEGGTIVYANPRAAALLDHPVEALLGRDAQEFYVDPAERGAMVEGIERQGRVENLVVRLRTRTNWPFWALVSAQRILFEGRNAVLVGLSDITAQKVAEAAVRRSEQSIRALFAAAPVAMALVRLEDSMVLFANRRCADLFALGAEALEGQRSPQFYADLKDRDRLRAQAVEQGQVDGEEVRMRRASGEEFWALLSARAIDFEGAPALIAGISDITPQKELEAKLRDLATKDELTELYNRRHFLELAQVELSRVRRTRAPLSLAMIDVDHFKHVNDRFGHAAGDRALKELSRALRETVRTADVAARIGGEEFVLLLPDTALEGALAVTERLRDRVRKSELSVEGELLQFTVSAGVAELGPDEGMDSLLKRADDALYRAKAAGRDRALPAEALV
jgi:diguanylate cyclase (GGDEF)-like protein/PAS domain S-box-containing protein